ncbi:calpain-3-like isoform X2 [Cimex lectularius]|nr:calpain-3-like isoform X2 [Cimex lectularius]
MKLREELRNKNMLFNDPEFPTTNNSLFFSMPPPWQVEWKRPIEIVQSPKFSLGRPIDLESSMFANCWYKVAIDSVMRDPEIFHWVISPNCQSFDQDYIGMFFFRIWRYGKWMTVIVDDRIPIRNDTNEFIGFKCEQSQFWICLYEKAYAKILGTYEDIEFTQANEAMEDLTGGLCELFHLPTSNYDDCLDTFNIMKVAFEMNSIIVCFYNEELTSEILSQSWKHIFITGLKVIYLNKHEEPYIKVSIPENHNFVSEWTVISTQAQIALGLPVIKTGNEMWVHLTEFVRVFYYVSICHLKGLRDHPWQWIEFHGSWVLSVSTGGSIHHSTFPQNPQFRFCLTTADPEPNPKNECTVIIALLQKYRKASRKSKSTKLLKIGFVVYKINPVQVSSVLNEFYCKHHFPMISSNFYNMRKVSLRFKLPLGHYVIIPSTLNPNREGEFLLRIISYNAGGKLVQLKNIGYVFASYHWPLLIIMFLLCILLPFIIYSKLFQEKI